MSTVLKKIWKMTCSFCTFLGALVLLIFGGLLVLFWFKTQTLQIEDHTFLMIDFAKPISESENTPLWNELTDEPPLVLSQLLQSIAFAAGDDRITGLVAKINTSSLEPAQVQDLARAITAFRATGKKTYVFSQGFGSLGQGNLEYYLASFFDEIYMQPHTYIGLTGVEIEVPFFKNVLQKIGVNPEFYARHEYKNAMASLTDSQMSKAYTEEMNKLGLSLMLDLQLDISNNRELSESFYDIVNKAPLTAEEGKKLNLIDGIMYLPQLEEHLRQNGASQFTDISDYMTGLYPNEGDLPTIAVLNLNGVITGGLSNQDLDGEISIGSQSVLEDIAAIKELPNLKAVLLRINSPGGDYNAADEIYFALKQLKEELKIPLIVSQSAYAASGGYFISLAGDEIVAEPMTITGSIGVFGGKMVFEKMWQKLGINWNRITFGTNAGILSMNKPFSASEKKIFNASLDEVYKDFTEKTVANRQLSRPIEEVARGRIWTGRQALSVGLIDMLGGYQDALALALKKAEITENQDFKLVNYPQPKSFSERVGDLLANTNSIKTAEIFRQSGVDIPNLKLFKRLQYDTVMIPFEINM